MVKPVLLPQKGERALIVGQTGGGKTAFACWILKRWPDAPVIIYDTKEEPKFLALPKSIVVTSLENAEQAIDTGENDYIVFRPPLGLMNDPEALDDLLKFHYHNWREVAAYIDETYSFHKNGRAGTGLIGLLTRGRSRGITTIMSTQRPAWISMFAISEAQRIYAFNLTRNADKKALGDVVPNFEDTKSPPKFGFWYFEVGTEKPIAYNPVKLDPALNSGYIDVQPDEAEAETETSRHLWI